MDSGGHTPEEIWKKTGWFRGAEDMWRFEIPNDKLDIARLGKPYMVKKEFPFSDEEEQPFTGFILPALKRAYDFPEQIWGTIGDMSGGGQHWLAKGPTRHGARYGRC
jgi:hypothetical protein